MEEEKRPHPRSYSSGLAAFRSIAAIFGTLFLLVMVVLGAIALRGGLLRVFGDEVRELPPIGRVTAMMPSFDGMGCLGVAIFASALLIVMGMMLCCCKRKEPDLSVLLRTLLQPIMTALRLLATSIATLGQGIATLTTLMTTVIEMLGTISGLLRNLDLSSPDAGAATKTAETIAGTASNLLQTGIAIGTQLGEQTKKTAEDVFNTTTSWTRD